MLDRGAYKGILMEINSCEPHSHNSLKKWAAILDMGKQLPASYNILKLQQISKNMVATHLVAGTSC